ncbi:GGDEF domain-containing protein [Paenibacillus chondroitinus]|uniref:GGDEF domain-containing protein n=1 Tax=Paenibacillus chondroitinus TaxID=59842 RepID=A0ABU6D8E6_9BACL|nr:MULTISPECIES: GGDEF domain-containing protein [Paenibacillus]MCY9661615.1 GGDEF domain-containing protein [Paenibacillus anseongense]MEB4793700.1 GGDEF domain-containing protein [Paenibacillus chondroitinus]
MNELFMDFLTILLPSFFFFYMAVTLLHRNIKSMLNRIAALLMLAFQFYFLGEYIKTSLLPQYQMQIVLYGNSPMLLLVICCLVHLSVLIGNPATSAFKRFLPFIYAAPYTLWLGFLITKDHRVLYNAEVTDGRSPLDPQFLLITVLFIAGYILLSVIILAVSWFRVKEIKHRQVLRSLLLSLFLLFAWFVLVTFLLQSKVLTSRNAMILFFIGYLLWAVTLRHLVGKYDIMPDYRKLFHILFKSAPTAILLLDQKGDVKEMNPRAKQWLEGIPVHHIMSYFQFENNMPVVDMLALVQQENEVQWEAQLHNPKKGDLDLIMGLELIEETDEKLYVMHLTDVTSLKVAERKLLKSEQNYKYLAHHDSLTDLYNRAALHELLLEKIERRESFALILIDLDNFKPINDRYGHFVGDLYLKHIALMLENCSQPDDKIGRIGGDEFVWIISSMDDNSELDRIVDHRLSLLQKTPFTYKGIEIPISFSAGVSQFPRDATDITTLMKNADEAMYTMKRARKTGISSLAD